MKTVVVGDAIIDQISRPGEAGLVRQPGGGALNVAVGLTLLGRAATLIYLEGLDPAGRVIQRHLNQHGVKFISLPSGQPTGIATAVSQDRPDGPAYSFNQAMTARRYRFDSRAHQAIQRAGAVTLTAFPFEDPRSVAGFIKAAGATGGLRLIDPNPRPALIADRQLYLDGLLAAAAISDLVKLSLEDLHFLSDGQGGLLEQIKRRCRTVLVTQGPAGAVVHLPDGGTWHSPAAALRRPVADTLGAGDAVLAAIVSELELRHSLADQNWWSRVLPKAMEVAAWTCRGQGGLLRLPPKWGQPAITNQQEAL
ncbi:MAG: PfkB family carbohydrate kinase [Bifidobacteriaceae bacterium]|jgi:fructokinase|nr:PfkB family carbohydrate kinase [Bifidobacteriaceae bacterium]